MGSSPLLAATAEGIVDFRFSFRSSAVCARSIRCRNSADGSSSNLVKRRDAAGSKQQQQQRINSDGRGRGLWATRSGGAELMWRARSLGQR